MSKPVLIEKWLPLAELGIESKRERGASSALPPLNFLHVWWARRPLTLSRAAIIASLLPQWDENWSEEIKKEFPDEESYGGWFLRLIGIFGDPLKAYEKIEQAKKTGDRISNPYDYPRAFTSNPYNEDLDKLNKIFEHTWGEKEKINVGDLMAGGGSIPFEAIRYGLKTFANDLNPVASVLMKATIEFPAIYGRELLQYIEKYGEVWYEKVKRKLDPFFSDISDKKAVGVCYFWARTVPCPTTGKPVPLSPNWWLRKGSNPVAVKLLSKPDWEECKFEIVEGRNRTKEVNPDEGTVKRGVGISPWTGETISGDYIKKVAQEGRMKEQLFAVAIKKGGGFDFRTPIEEDFDAVEKTKKELELKKEEWIEKNIVPVEKYPEGSNDPRPILYGMSLWKDLFSPRQLFSLCTFLETLKEVEEEIKRDIKDKELSKAIMTYFGLVLDKCVDYNSILVKWDGTRKKICNTFDRHDFSFKWSHAEFDASRNLLPWAINQVADAYEGICDLIGKNLYYQSNPRENIFISSKNAAYLPDLPNGSFQLICVDPPYYDNVMYSELSDFFYVWQKRSIGHLYPEFFSEELTNKDDEAVANVARFRSLGRGKKRDLAEKDYERKMAACFKEMHRILKADGVLTLMFTHKKTEAWNTLARALIEGGFSIRASWPVHTESEHSLHQAKKNAAASTILLVCRKRKKDETAVWWEDIRGRVRETAREKAVEFQSKGIEGVDLYISTFGPVLSILSENWPVLTSEIDENSGESLSLSPEVALNIAREEVLVLRKRGLLRGRDVKFDPITDWYILAWDLFKAEEIPFDEARKLGIALGIDIDKDVSGGKKLIRKKGNFVSLRLPDDRKQRGLVDPESDYFDCLIDLIHTAMLIYEEDGSRACEMFLTRQGAKEDGTFKALLEALIKAIPRIKEKGKFVRPEAEVLEKMRLAFFDDIETPPEEVNQDEVNAEKPVTVKRKLPMSGGSLEEE